MTSSSPDVVVQILPEDQQQHFRLLELPADLLAYLTEQKDPPLQLKSRPGHDETSQEASVVLCTADKTFNIRQVNTSNSIWLTKSIEDASSRGIETIAKIDSAIELSPALKSMTAHSHIKRALPVLLSIGQQSSQKIVTKLELFNDIPLDAAACEQAFVELSCFEATDGSGCFLPSAKVKADILGKIAPLASASGIDLTTTSFISQQVPNFLIDLSEDWSTTLLLAVLHSVSNADHEEQRLDRWKFVQNVGLSMLRASSEIGPTNTATFLQTWRDAMPESWRGDCELSSIRTYHTTQNSNSTIGYLEGSNPIYDTPSSASNPASTTLGAATNNKRKWHDKFRPAKKTS